MVTPATRFRITHTDSVEPLKHDAALSKAITRAVQSADAGVWTVTEYDDPVWRVTRDEDGNILIEDLA